MYSLIFLFADVCSWIIFNSWVLRSLVSYSAVRIAKGHNPTIPITFLFFGGIIFHDSIAISGLSTLVFIIGGYQLSSWLFIKSNQLGYVITTWGVLVESGIQLWGMPTNTIITLTLQRLTLALFVTFIINHIHPPQKP